jgi:hypothetical protein
MENTAITKTDQNIISSLVLNGDLSKLSQEQKVSYYKSFCDSLGLNSLTQPFQLLTLNGKQRLYATKDATEQLRKIHGVSIYKLDKTIESGLCIFTAYAKDKEGKEDASSGAVNIENLKGEALANAIMKAETKSKRRVTLSICGLGMLDENEVETIPGAQTQPFEVHTETVEAKVVNDEDEVKILHDEYMGLWNEFKEIQGTEIATPYHPSRWQSKRLGNYKAAIKSLNEKLETLKQTA